MAQNTAFPTALLSGGMKTNCVMFQLDLLGSIPTLPSLHIYCKTDLDEAIAKTLYKRGFTPENTILAHSVCSDEVNNKEEQLVALMVNRWQEGKSTLISFYQRHTFI